jgi:hypothetical protein
MRVIHDYNVRSLEEISNDIDELAKLLTVLNTYVHEKGYDDGAAILLDRLETSADVCDKDLGTRLSAIMRAAVPPEGKEPMPRLVYPE